MMNGFDRELKRLGIISKRKYPEDQKYNDPQSMHYQSKYPEDENKNYLEQIQCSSK